MTRLALVVIALFATAAANAAPVRQQLARPDGSMIDYTLDIPSGTPAGIVVLMTGSGCLPGAVNANIATARAAFPDHAALIVEKYGIAPDAAIADGFTDCPPAFHAGHTVSQRVADSARVIGDVRAMLPATSRLVLFGGSEGGLTVALLSTMVQADAVIILSSGIGMAFADLVLGTVPPEGRATVSAGFAAARVSPHSTELFAGSSYRFWADILRHRSVDAMLRTTAPFLLIQGGRDTASPLAAARAGADLFAAQGRCNLTYWEFPALEHGMTDPTGRSRLASVLAMAAHWAAAPMPAC